VFSKWKGKTLLILIFEKTVKPYSHAQKVHRKGRAGENPT
jgi:hypothetical protein